MESVYSKYKTMLGFISLALIVFVVLGLVFGQYASLIRFSYLAVIIFYLIACIVVVVGMELILNKLSLNGSYVYLLTIVLKVGFFMLIFNDSAMSLIGLVKVEKMVLIVPMFSFLVVEALYLMRKMNN